jgi:quinol monooxygenase YgiN
MAIAVYSHPKELSLETFEEIHRRLTAAGAGEPAGRLHHSCFGDDGNLMIYDIWESQEAFDSFGQTLMPIIAELGADPGEPAIIPLHHLDQTSSTIP